MNRKIWKRLGTAILAFVMLLGMLPGTLTVSAEEGVAFSASFAGPYAKVGKPLTVEVTGASGTVTYSWSVDGSIVSTDASYTPTEDDLMKWIAVTVKSGSDTAELEMFFSELPVVYINTEGGQAITSKEYYINADLIIQGNEMYNSGTTTLYNGLTEIRGRGNSTWAQPKKPYRLKLDKKTDLFGMGKSKHWVLLANYLDESLQRNTLAYNLSGAMGMEQMSTVFVDVVLNGDFVGNYQLCENIRVDDTRVDIFDWEGFAEDSAAVIAEAVGMDEDTAGDLETYMAENMGWITSGTVTFNGVTYTIANYPDIEIPAITGGYLIELDEYYDEVSKFKTDSNQPIMFKNPEFVATNSDMMAYVQEYIQAFEDAVQADSYTAVYDGRTVHYSELYDFDALVDYWLINEIFFNEEINKKSTYMYKDIDGLMYMGPIWDMDWSSGGEGATYQTEQWATRYYSTNAQANQWYKYLIQDPWFFIKAQERYWEIRNAQVADMLAELDSNEEMLTTSAAANGARWGYKYEYRKYVDDLRSWFNSHLSWLDTQMATQDSLRDSLGYYPSSRLALTLTDAEGNALAADTAKTAPADATAAAGQSLKLQIQGGSNTDGNAVLYVNGRRASVSAMTANTTITVDVPADSLTAPVGEKNVIEVQIEKADGTINASRYVTVITREETAACQHENTEIRNAVAATCKDEGYTGDTWCLDCGSQIGSGTTIPTTDHTEEVIPGTPATFDAAGTTDGVKCSVCGMILVAQETAPMLDYNEGIVPLDTLNVTCGDYETNGGASEGPANLAVDNNLSTIWHTDWYGTSRADHWIQFELTEEYAVDGLRYKPRTTGNTNGIITEYDIQVSDDGVTFTSVASGNWAGDRNWKVVEFAPQTVKYVRLVAVNALTDNAYVFASAAEIRLTGQLPVVSDADKTQLDALIAECEKIEQGNYTAKSWQAFQTALANARAVSANQYATQTRVDQAYAALNQAKLSLVEKVDGEGIQKIFHLDCGRKYFSKDWTIALLNELSAAGYTHLQLAFGNNGFRFVLDDMTIEANGKTYASDDVKAGIKHGNANYYDEGENHALTESEMDEILAHAASVGVEIVPHVNMPGHMNALLDAMEYVGIQDAHFTGHTQSASSVNLNNQEALNFMFALTDKYAAYFSEAGCKYFHIGADEYANDAYGGNMGFPTMGSALYAKFADFVNDNAAIVEGYGMTPRAWNDGISYGSYTAQFDPSIEVHYWSSGWWGYNLAGADDLANNGHGMINTNGDYYYILGKDDRFTTGSGTTHDPDLYTACEGFDVTYFMDGSTIEEPVGATFCVWADYPGAETEQQVAANIRLVLRAMALRMDGLSLEGMDTSVVAGGFNEDGTINESEAPHEHKYQAEVTEPTCTEPGFTTYTCECGDSYVADETPALGHDFVDGVCTRCGEAEETPVQNPFVDVPEGSFYIDPVLWAVEKGITTGVDDTHFGPLTACNRAQVVTFLWRAAGSPEPTITENPFVDVPAGTFYYKAVLWAVEAGITTGVSPDHFNPFGDCTRGQVVTFLWRAVGAPKAAGESAFTDVTDSNAYYYDAVLWAVKNGVTTGVGDGTFGVNNVCNRAQVVTFLYRAYK